MASFPQGFLWGDILAINQSEGAYPGGDKGSTIVDILPHGAHCLSAKLGLEKRLTLREDEFYPSYEVIDFHYRYKEDVALMVETGFDAFRASIVWSRPPPCGDEQQPSPQGTVFCRSLFKECKKYGIESLVTLCHFDMLMYLAVEYGSWCSRKTVDFFSHHTRTCSEAFDGLVKYWLTLNEINIMSHNPYSGIGLMFEEGENQEQVEYQAVHYELVVSALATKIAHKINLQSRVDCMLIGGNFYLYSCKPEDVWMALEKDCEDLFFIDAQTHSAYPVWVARMFWEKGVTIVKQSGDNEILKNAVDFVFPGYYALRRASTETNAGSTNAANIIKSLKSPHIPVSEWGRGIDLLGPRITVDMVYDRYRRPLFLVENELGARGEIDANGDTSDDYRTSYPREHTRTMCDAIGDGIPMLGRASWGHINLVLMPADEMSRYYGFIYADRDDAGNDTLARKCKESFF